MTLLALQLTESNDDAEAFARVSISLVCNARWICLS